MGCAQPSESATPPADPPAGCQRCRFPSWPGATLKQPLKRGLPRKGTQNKSTPSSAKLIDCGLELADSDVDLGENPKRGPPRPVRATARLRAARVPCPQAMPAPDRYRRALR